MLNMNNINRFTKIRVLRRENNSIICGRLASSFSHFYLSDKYKSYYNDKAAGIIISDFFSAINERKISQILLR